MNENVDLTKILKNCPEDFELYTPLHGKVYFSSINENGKFPIVVKTELLNTISFTKEGYYFIDATNGECLLLPSNEMRDWSKFIAPWYKKEELIKPKFKVGDRIRHKETNKDDVYEISKVYADSYGIIGFNWGIYMKYQDQYELVPNKFDPKTLKPFDRVLVRYEDNDWLCSFFSHHKDVIDSFPRGACAYYIPYNDNTKHLVGTKEEAPDFYKYWED